MKHEWRGNVRELMQVVRRLVALCEDNEAISLDLLPADLREAANDEPDASATCSRLRDDRIAWVSSASTGIENLTRILHRVWLALNNFWSHCISNPGASRSSTLISSSKLES